MMGGVLIKHSWFSADVICRQVVTLKLSSNQMPHVFSKKLINKCTFIIRWQFLIARESTSFSVKGGKMADSKKLLCLFDVDGTLTAPRKVTLKSYNMKNEPNSY